MSPEPLQYSMDWLLICSTSSTIIQDIQGMHAAGLATMAYYYFDFRDVKKQDRYFLLSSLLSSSLRNQILATRFSPKAPMKARRTRRNFHCTPPEKRSLTL